MDVGFVARVLGAVEPRNVDRFDRAVEPRSPSRIAAGEPGRGDVAFELSLSPEARALADAARPGPEAASSSSASSEERLEEGARLGSSGPGELTPEEEEEVLRLKKRDAEVRAHENAHKAAAGRYARGGPTYEFERGPDGRRYAVGGEVQIDTAPVPNDPDATIQKMQTVRRAALAPAEPSPQDRRVASEASAQETAARQEKLAVQREERAALRKTGYEGPVERPVGGALDVVA